LALPFGWRSWRCERPELMHALGWAVSAWLLYGATSTNSAGVCCSIRWLVPLLAPGYYVLALVLRDRPEWRADFLLLSAWGLVYGAILMAGGPWREIDPLLNWMLVSAAATTWIALRWLRRHHEIHMHGSDSLRLATTMQSVHRSCNRFASDSTANRSVA